MFEKNISFKAPEIWIKYGDDLPTPIKLNIPEWFKKLDHDLHNRTIKGCIPFLETLTSGYLLKTPQDLFINHNIFNKEKGIWDTEFRFADSMPPELMSAENLNLNHTAKITNLHPKHQLEGSPFIDKNKNQPFYKWFNPWTIITPPGYSCLFVPPLNNTDDRFSIIPGIVDTDTFTNPINFPFVINGDKYENLNTVIKKGTPYVQIIPFKRDSWKMKIETLNKIDGKQPHFINLRFVHNYKNKYWSKKKWT